MSDIIDARGNHEELRKVNRKYLLSFENCCWRRVERVNCAYGVKNEVLQRVKKDSCILHAIKRRLTVLVRSSVVTAI